MLGAVHKLRQARPRGGGGGGGGLGGGGVGGCRAQRYEALHGGGGVSGRSLRNANF